MRISRYTVWSIALAIIVMTCAWFIMCRLMPAAKQAAEAEFNLQAFIRVVEYLDDFLRVNRKWPRDHSEFVFHFDTSKVDTFQLNSDLKRVIIHYEKLSRAMDYSQLCAAFELHDPIYNAYERYLTWLYGRAQTALKDK